MAERCSTKKFSSRKIEETCPDIIFARLLSNLNDIFKHENFKSKLQEQAVKKVSIRKLPSSKHHQNNLKYCIIT